MKTGDFENLYVSQQALSSPPKKSLDRVKPNYLYQPY